jgi:hypothetical protein
MVLNPHNKAVLNERALVDPGSYASAILNILDDFTDERERRGDIQRAVVNTLEDFAGERMRLRDTQRAVLNILDNFDIERKMAERANIELRDENIERTRGGSPSSGQCRDRSGKPRARGVQLFGHAWPTSAPAEH